MKTEKITKTILFIVLAVTPFVETKSLFFPFISGKVYLFRFLVEIAFLFWIALILKKPEHRPNFKNPIVLSTILLLFGLVVTALFGVDPVRSFFSDLERGKGVIQFAHWILYFLMLTSVLKKKKDWKIFLGIFLIDAVLLSLWSWHKGQPSFRALFGNPAFFASFLIFGLGFSALYLERGYFKILGKKINQFIGFSALAVFLGMTLIYTGIRGAFAAVGVAFFFFTIFSIFSFWKRRKKLVIALIIFLIAGSLFAVLTSTYKDSEVVQNNKLLQRTTGVFSVWETDSFRQRIYTWRAAMKSFKDRPILGWGMENFKTAFNKHYDYRIGLKEPWFDRVHNQTLQYLVDGGAVLFSIYLFWISVFFYSAFRIAKNNKLLGGILMSVFIAYLVQGWFLFDTLPAYLGLFALLAFTSVKYDSLPGKREGFSEAREEKGYSKDLSGKEKAVLGVITCIVFVSLYGGVWLPYKANAALLNYFSVLVKSRYAEAPQYFKESMKYDNPYTYFDVRKWAGWELSDLLQQINYGDREFSDREIKEINKLYTVITPELEEAVEYRPTDPQIYYLMGQIYRLGYKGLGRDDLAKAEAILKRATERSKYRIEYFNELGQVLLLRGKFEEGEKMVKDYIERAGTDLAFSHATLGHLYFVSEKYDLAMEQYEIARKKGHDFIEIDQEYSRYMEAAQETENYKGAIELTLEKLDRRGPGAGVYLNLAIAYGKMGNKEKAREYFSKAVELNEEYKKHEAWFKNL